MQETADSVTVTVDSATVGNDSFFLLLRVSGLPFSPRHSYGFDQVYLEVTPDPLENARGLGGYGIEFQGLDGDGAALFLMDYDYARDTGYQADDQPLHISMFLTDLMEDLSSDHPKLLAEGTWTFRFTLERNQPQEIPLADAQVMAFDPQAEVYTQVPVTLTHLYLTNTGLRFQYDDQNGTRSIDSHICAILSSGQEISTGGGVGTRMEDGSFFCSYTWLIPVSLEEVTALRIGGVEIPVP